jgi:hypothetical protein
MRLPVQDGLSDKRWQPITSAEHDFCRRHLETRNYYFGRKGRDADGRAVDYSNGRDALTLAIRNWKINTVRFNVSQSALDPKSPFYEFSYAAEIQQVVEHARNRGLIVILALFDARNFNAPKALFCKNPMTPIDTVTTLRAARNLAKLFGDDQGVFLELLNEPFQPFGRLKSLRAWRDGGRGQFNDRCAGDSTYPLNFVGVNAIIDTIRTTGAKNPIILQGVGGTLEDLPEGIVDPLNKLIYSVHPFMARLNWFQDFGRLAQFKPVIVTAWNFSSKDDWCLIHGIGKTSEFLRYLRVSQIGVIGYALDVPRSATLDFEKTFDKPSPTLAKGSCSRTDISRSGALLNRYFNTVNAPPRASESSINLTKEADDTFGSSEHALAAASSVSPVQSKRGRTLNHVPRIREIVVLNIKPGGVEDPSQRKLKVGKPFRLRFHVSDIDRDPINARVAWGDDNTAPAGTAFLELENESVWTRRKKHKGDGFHRYSENSKAVFDYQYNSPGAYKIQIVVVDSKGKQSSERIIVFVER